MLKKTVQKSVFRHFLENFDKYIGANYVGKGSNP